MCCLILYCSIRELCVHGDGCAPSILAGISEWPQWLWTHPQQHQAALAQRYILLPFVFLSIHPSVSFDTITGWHPTLVFHRCSIVLELDFRQLCGNTDFCFKTLKRLRIWYCIGACSPPIPHHVWLSWYLMHVWTQACIFSGEPLVVEAMGKFAELTDQARLVWILLIATKELKLKQSSPQDCYGEQRLDHPGTADGPELWAAQV